MCNMSDLNDLYNAQDMILSCEIMENSFETMFNMSGYNPRKINSASKMSSCIQREKSKVILALPTSNAIMETFKKTITGGFSSISTQLFFDTELLMPNLTPAEYNKIKIDESFRVYKRNGLKTIYKIKFDKENAYHERRVITKILKLDENNQYGYAMTKHMSTGYIKEHPSPTMLKFNLLLESVNLDDEIGYLFVVEIELDEKNTTSEIYYIMKS